MAPSREPVTGYEDLQIRQLSPQDRLWADLDERRDLSIYHTRDWADLVERSFGHSPRYLAALRRGQMVDLLPAFLIRFPVLGTKLISTPYEGCHGGYVSSDREAQRAIAATLIDIARHHRARHAEIRSQQQTPVLERLGFVEQEPLLATILELVDERSNWREMSSKHRRNVRISKKRGITIETAKDMAEMRIFYKIIHRHYHDLGLPFFSIKFFENIWSFLVEKSRAELLLAKTNDRIVGGHLLFSSGDVLISKYSAYLKTDELKKSYASYALFWEAIKRGNRNGLKRFNMGVTGTNNTGLLDFKNRFGSTTEPIFFYNNSFRGRTPDYSKYYGQYQFLKRAWRHVPSGLAMRLGSLVNTWIC